MSRAAFNLVVAAVHAWTWLYTLPLDPVDADTRRREIESDVWEFAADDSAGAPSAGAAIHLLARLLLGVPDDLLWACERLSDAERRTRRGDVMRVAAVAVAAATVVASASGPMLDPASALRVDVDAVGWISDTTSDAPSRPASQPAIAFTLTNSGTRRTGALQVNAVFHRADDDVSAMGLGTAFAAIVGWRGLKSGETSARILLHGQPVYVMNAVFFRRIPVPLDRLDAARARLFVQHEGRWTSLGDFAIPARPMPR